MFPFNLWFFNINSNFSNSFFNYWKSIQVPLSYILTQITFQYSLNEKLHLFFIKSFPENSFVFEHVFLFSKTFQIDLKLLLIILMNLKNKSWKFSFLFLVKNFYIKLVLIKIILFFLTICYKILNLKFLFIWVMRKIPY